MIRYRLVPCPECKGSGTLDWSRGAPFGARMDTCDVCGGAGKRPVEIEEPLTLTLEQQQRLAGYLIETLTENGHHRVRFWRTGSKP